MTPQQLTLAIVIPSLIPTFAVVIGILRTDSNIESLRNDLRADIRILNTIAYEHNGRLAGLEAKKPS